LKQKRFVDKAVCYGTIMLTFKGSKHVGMVCVKDLMS